MNLNTILTDTDIIHHLRLAPTLVPGQARQICFACEKPIRDRSHYRVQVTGASGAHIGVQICLSCQRPLVRAASERRRQGKPDPIVLLTEEEKNAPPPQPINLGSIYAPRHPTNFFQEDDHAL